MYMLISNKCKYSKNLLIYTVVLCKTKMLTFHSHFFNMDISVNIAHTPFNFEPYIHEIPMQNFDLGPIIL